MPNKEQYIQIKGAKVHNLKNIDIDILRDKFVVITGVSGSGKSSLAFDTIYAEGQRRYVESLSSYARQFLGKINKPDVEFIHGIPPAIAIEQKVNTRNPRSTVGTSTEVYDYLKLLFARIGKTYSPISKKLVQRHSITDVVDYITSFKENTKLLILASFQIQNGKSFDDYLKMLQNEGISRIEQNFKIYKITDILESTSSVNKKKPINIVVDRISVQTNEDSLSRFADSVQIAFSEGKGYCIIKAFGDKNSLETFSNKFEADGIEFEEPTVHTFSFNNPVGACPKCEGYGKIIGIDEDLVIPNKGLSIYEEAIACWRGEKMQEWKNKLIYNAEKFNFPIHKPYFDLTEDQKQLLWTGNKYFGGLNVFFEHLEEQKYKIQYRVMLSRYRGKTTCPDCRGTRLKKEASYVKVGNKSLQDLVLLPIDELQVFFRELKLNNYERDVSKRILIEINSRLDFLMNVGLGYLTLNRLSSTLSGGESQRINLATSLGSSLVGSLYILDEPSIGLHSRDNNRLIKVLKELQKIGNTVIVVEHDEDIIKSADEIIDIGPFAGRLGGNIIFQGNRDQIIKNKNSLTAKYLTGKEFISTPKQRRKWNNYIELTGARENNLKNIDVKFPLNTLTVITGVSGSGKSSLVEDILFRALKKHLHGSTEQVGAHESIEGLENIDKVIVIDQSPIGRTPRSNPATYTGAFTPIRQIFSRTKLAKERGYKPGQFSFNVKGGRCENCEGDGIIKLEMHFLPDIYIPCEVCKEKRYTNETLEVKFKNRSIADVLGMSVEEALEFFKNVPAIHRKLKTLWDVGLGYIKLGQPAPTLSGGEAQRVKLSTELSKRATGKTIYLLDEPTTGLHFDDVSKLLNVLRRLRDKGNSVVVIEHNLDVVKTSDWIIDLGPEGGDEGGEIVAQGSPEEVARTRGSYTGEYLKLELRKKDRTHD